METRRQHEQKQFDWSDNTHLMPSQLLHPSLTVHTCSTKSTAQTAANLRGNAKCVPLTLMKQSALYVVHEDHEDHGGSWRALKIDKQKLYTQNVFQEIIPSSSQISKVLQGTAAVCLSLIWMFCLGVVQVASCMQDYAGILS